MTPQKWSHDPFRVSSRAISEPSPLWAARGCRWASARTSAAAPPFSEFAGPFAGWVKGNHPLGVGPNKKTPFGGCVKLGNYPFSLGREERGFCFEKHPFLDEWRGTGQSINVRAKLRQLSNVQWGCPAHHGTVHLSGWPKPLLAESVGLL